MGAGGVIVPPATYFDKVHGGLRQVRRLRDLRRGDLRLRPARHPIRLPGLRLRAAFDHGRQGADLGLCADGGAHGAGSRCIRRCSTQSRKIGTFGHGFTYSGHPVAAAVALKTLEIYERERLVEAGGADGAAVPGAARGAWQRIRWSGEARGFGLVGAVELVADKADQALVRSEGRRRPARGGVLPKRKG